MVSIILFGVHWCSGVINFSRIVLFFYYAIPDDLDYKLQIMNKFVNYLFLYLLKRPR